MLKISDVVTLAGLEQAAKEIPLRSCSGVDDVTPKQFRQELKDTFLGQEIVEKLLLGEYKPQALLEKLIPKPNGTKRTIYVPTVQDRAIQRMIAAKLTTITERRFHEWSFGFRPARNCQQAVQQAANLIKLGYSHCVLIDLENFFGLIGRERLRKLLRDYELDSETRTLTNQFIKARPKGQIPSQNGIPAGIPLAPVLANIYLHPLDQELEKRGIKFVRYADDITLFFKTEEECLSFIFGDSEEQRFGIRINYQKTKQVSKGKRPILGFELDDYGGVTFRPEVTDAVRKSMFGLLTDSNISLQDLKQKVRVRLKSTLAYYKIADNFAQLVSELDQIQDEFRRLVMAKYPKLEILDVAGIRLMRVDEFYLYDEMDAIVETFPTLTE